MDRSSACSSSSFSFDGQRVSMFLKADLLMSLNMHLILQPTLLQHQHFPSSSISWDKSLLLPLPSAPSQSNPIQRPQTHQCFFERTREKIPGTDLRQMLEQGLFSVLLLQCWQLMYFHGYRMRKKKKEKMYSNEDPEEKVSEGECFLDILTLFQ